MKYEIESIGKFKMIHIVGNIDTETSTKILDDKISELIEKGHHHFVFNLERTTYLDSAGISIFIHCLCDVQQNDGSVYIIAEDNQVKRVLEMVGIIRLIETYGSQQEFEKAVGIAE
ncbi:STAS domain-containing protein [Chitinispirillales bacterium ANBcel5]|uniref:STAS domain-containing protein n=1 Tax=Cellulosispirillum alkaliphilum TaxID=3039283 RepID=UPI002A537B3D|nr:STAS domain-containing protein [Chitinispirillales bacterium ANBcel5]